MFDFRTKYSPQLSDSSVTGSGVSAVYAGRYDDDGYLVVDEVGTEDIYSQIQSWADSVDINAIVSRYASGDSSALDNVQGFYADVSDLPTSYSEFLNKVLETRDFFDSLPVEYKMKFDNSYENFLVSTQRPDFLDLLSVPASESFSDSINPDPKNEVIADES